MDQKELNERLEAHRLWLSDRNLGQRLSLFEQDLSYLDFSASVLNDAEFQNCNLKSARFVDCRARRSKWTSCNLAETSFRNAFLHRADFYLCKMQHINFKRAMLNAASVRQCDLFRACLEQIDMNGLIGNGDEIKTIEADLWTITYTYDRMQIGCENNSLHDWWTFSDDEIAEMDDDAPQFWEEWRSTLREIVEVIAPAEPTRARK